MAGMRSAVVGGKRSGQPGFRWSPRRSNRGVLTFPVKLAGSWEERPGLLQARADGARRGALSGGGVRHMLVQISPLSDLVRQVIWGLCWAASRGAPGRRTSGEKSKYSEIPPAFV